MFNTVGCPHTSLLNKLFLAKATLCTARANCQRPWSHDSSTVIILLCTRPLAIL